MTETIDTSGYEQTGNYLNASKVETRKELQVPLIITDVKNQKMKDNTKIVLSFGGVPDSMVLNKTNFTIMKNAKGNNPLLWIGATITLGTTPSMYEGKITKSVVILKVA